MSLRSPKDVSVSPINEVFVADSGNHRVLRYLDPASGNADYVWGQPDFTSDTANNGGISGSSLNGPTALVADVGMVFVSDTGNHRVLRFRTNLPLNTAITVIGQADYVSGLPNRGGVNAGASTLHTPGGISVDPGGRVYISDVGNNRVAAYTFWADSGAGNIYGQVGFAANVAGIGNNRFNAVSDVFIGGGVNLIVGDTGNQRVLMYECVQNIQVVSPSPSPTFTLTVTPAWTLTATLTQTPATATPSSTATTTATISVTTTQTPTASSTATHSPTASMTPTFTVTNSFTLTNTPIPTLSFTLTATQTQTPLATQTPYPRPSHAALAWPNPVARGGQPLCIAYPDSNEADVLIYNLLGERVIELGGSQVDSARGLACWDLRNSHGNMVAPGIYYYRVRASGQKFIGKFTVH